MTTITLQGGTVVLRDGQVGTEESCCCPGCADQYDCGCYCRHTIANPNCDACPPGYVLTGNGPCNCVFTSDVHDCFPDQPLQVCIDKAIEAGNGNGTFEQDVPAQNCCDGVCTDGDCPP